MAETPPDYNWRYLHHGRVRHLLTNPHESVCGLAPTLFGAWYGTGSQAEYDECAGLPACKKCLAAVPAAAGWEVAT